MDTPRLRQSTHGHPVIVLRIDGETATIGYLSTQFELKRPGDHTINELDDGFETTGLRQSSYIVQRQVLTLNIAYLRNAIHVGHVTGTVKKLIEDWWGEPL